MAISRKSLAIIAVLIIFAYTWDVLLEWLGHAIALTLEWLELTVDTLFEELLQFTPEASQTATAWSGFLVLLVMLGWGGYKLRRLYLNVRPRIMAWKNAKANTFWDWWGTLPWFQKLAYAASLCLLLAFLILTS